VQLQCVQLITEKTNEADLSSDAFAILISFTCSYSTVITKPATRSNFDVIYLFLLGYVSRCGKYRQVIIGVH